jgi:replication factor A1
MKIEEIKSYQKKIDVLAKVVEKTENREVNSRLDETKHIVCEALLADETGKVYLTLWDDAINMLDVGNVYQFKNLFSSEFKKSLRLNIGRFGTFEKTDKNIDIKE